MEENDFFLCPSSELFSGFLCPSAAVGNQD